MAYQPQVPQQALPSFPAGLKLTRKNIEKANKEGSFWRVTSFPKRKGVTRKLGSAPKQWEVQAVLDKRTVDEARAEQNTIFVTTTVGVADSPEPIPVRVSGTEQDVRAALANGIADTFAERGYDANSIRDILANAITRNNYQTSKAAEFQALSTRVQKSTDPSLDLSFAQIVYFSQMLKDKEKSSEIPGQKVRAKTGKGTGRGQTIAEKYRKLEDPANFGKVLNVTDYLTKGNAGATLIKGIVGQDDTRSFIAQGGPRIVTGGKAGSGANIDAYVKALTDIFGPDSVRSPQFQNWIEQTRAKYASVGQGRFVGGQQGGYVPQQYAQQPFVPQQQQQFVPPQQLGNQLSQIRAAPTVRSPGVAGPQVYGTGFPQPFAQ